MANKNNNKAAFKEQDTKVMDGVDSHLATATTLGIGGEQFTPAELKGVFKADLDAMDETDAARTTLKQKVLAQKAARKRAGAVRKNLKAFLIGQNGPGAVQILEDFGFAVPKPLGPKTASAKAEGASKAKATRTRKKAAEAAAEATPAPANPATK
jgi:hypothetical protein